MDRLLGRTVTAQSYPHAREHAVIVDNEEGSDVDIVDISDPKKPVFLTEYDLDELFPQILTCKG